MPRRVALLRGINVGRARRIAMADLRSLFGDLGYADVRTLLNSGNVVFSAGSTRTEDHSRRIQRAIEDRFGVDVRVVVMEEAALASAVHTNPLAKVADNPSRLLIMACADPAMTTRLTPLLKERWAPEAFALGPRVAYLWCADGIAGSPLWTAVNRIIGESGTARNLTTMTKLLAMMESGARSVDRSARL